MDCCPRRINYLTITVKDNPNTHVLMMTARYVLAPFDEHWLLNGLQADGLVVTVSQYLSEFYGYEYHLLGRLRWHRSLSACSALLSHTPARCKCPVFYIHASIHTMDTRMRQT